MPDTLDHREAITAALRAFMSRSPSEASRYLLATLGYESDRTLRLGDSKPETFLEFIRQNVGEGSFNEDKALVADWKSAELIFQLTDEELSESSSLFADTDVQSGLLRSYLFFAIELIGEHYARGRLTDVTRQINRVFPMPVMVLIKHRAARQDVLSIAVINRRQSKSDANTDVLGKVTIIRDITLDKPHRGHLDILDSFARPNLAHPDRVTINNFDTLHAAWEEVFNVELLNKRFYHELANWYFWALPQVTFPKDVEEDDEVRRATGLIRLLTRLIFCWFLKEKGLIPEDMFSEARLKNVLVDLEPASSTYYWAILQNLFFATLNQPMGKSSNGKLYRAFAKDEGFGKNRSTYGVDNLYRYEDSFRETEESLKFFSEIPFLNGGLFECLDRIEDGTNKKLYIDGFSRNKKKRPNIPNHLFFSEEVIADLSDAYGEASRRTEKVRGLLRILQSYKFTIVENTPIDQEIALDPELLGKVFENLLASYNEETKSTARKQTGSFYTPRPIVDYMVDESLKAYLKSSLAESGMSAEDADVGLEILFEYTEREHPFTDEEADTLLEAIHSCKVLDPACGSGAFPMGILQKLVYIIHKLDPDNKKWMNLQIAAASAISDLDAREAAIAAIRRNFFENEDDYGRKLHLIENCLFGTDIQPIAIQISKLRFFISLVCDQRTNRRKKDNHGVRLLPNLETKFVSADALINLPELKQLTLMPPRVNELEEEISAQYHRHFMVQRRNQKLAIQRKVKDLRNELAEILSEGFMNSDKAHHVAEWDPFDPQLSANFFDPVWMFGPSVADGFDIVIGNPPYIQLQKDGGRARKKYANAGWETFASTGDVYQLFYERGCGYLKPGEGTLAYITSNSWLKAKYGRSLRRWFADRHTPLSLIEMGKDVFNAIVDTAVLIVKNGKGEPVTCRAVDVEQASDDRFPPPKGDWGTLQPEGERPWMALSSVERAVMEKMETVGTPLRDWDISIYRGILTGFNDAFIVDQATHDALVAEDPKSADLLKPILRGRDIARYRANWAGLWLISTFPSLNLDIDAYPAIKRHLLSFGKERLVQEGRHLPEGGRSRKKTSNTWYELQDTCAYHADFEQDKTIWIELVDKGRFAFDNTGIFVEATAFMLIGAETKPLCALLNSTLAHWYIRKIAPTSGTGTSRWKKAYVESIPFVTTNADLTILSELVDEARNCNEPRILAQFDRQIDSVIFQAYGLSSEEARAIKSSIQSRCNLEERNL